MSENENPMIAALQAQRDALAAQVEEARAVWEERQQALARAQEAQAKRHTAITEQAGRAMQMAREQLLSGESDVDANDLLGDIQSVLLKRETERAETALAELTAQVTAAQGQMTAFGRQLADIDFQLAQIARQSDAVTLLEEFDAAYAAMARVVARMRAHNRAVAEAEERRHAMLSGRTLPTHEARAYASASLCLPGAREEYKQQHEPDQFAHVGVAVTLTSDLCVVHQDEDGILAALPQPAQPGAGWPYGHGNPVVYRRG